MEKDRAWFVQTGDGKKGPFQKDDLLAFIKLGELLPNSLVLEPEEANWKKAVLIPGLFVLQDANNEPDDQARPQIPQPSPPNAMSWLSNSLIGVHWRGEFSLPISYWAIGICAVLFATLTATVVGASLDSLNSDDDYSPWLALLAVLSIWMVILSVTTWQVVGVWRSATRYSKSNPASIWGGAAKVMVLLGCLNTVGQVVKYAVPQISRMTQIAIGDEEFAKHDIRILRNGSEIAYSGGISFGAAKDLKQILAAAPQIRVLHINSYGGRVAEARNLAKVVRERQLTTYVSETCASACTLVFLAGRQRWLGRSAKLGFHAPDYAKLMPPEQATALEAKDKAELQKLGVTASFANKVYSTSTDDMWWPTLPELTSANVISGVVGPESFAFSGLNLDLSVEAFNAQLSKIHLFRAMRLVEPAVYDKIVTAFYEGARGGDTQAEITARTRASAIPLFEKYLASASDDLLLDAMRLMLEELAVLDSANDGTCYAFLFPQKGRVAIDPMSHFSSDLHARDLEMFATLLESQSRAYPKISEAEFGAVMETVAAAIIRQHGLAVLKALVKMDAPNVDKALVCRATRALYKEIAELPARQSAPTLRYMFSAK